MLTVLGDMNYQWLSDGAAIIGAVQTSYTLSSMDVGKKISIAAYYVDSWKTHESVLSSSTKAVILSNIYQRVLFQSADQRQQAKFLTATNTLEDGNGLGVISYQWLRAGVEIKGANQHRLTR